VVLQTGTPRPRDRAHAETFAQAALGLRRFRDEAAVALASGIGPDLQLDPTKWTILHRGVVDDGKAKYVQARSKEDGGESTFFLEHDAGMAPYQAFLLHERVQAAAGEVGADVLAEPGPLCSRQQLTRAEAVALQTLRAGFSPGTPPAATRKAVDAAVSDRFAGNPCRGLEYAGERARFVFAGTEPESMLMPGVR
jgi:hypothetical protein